jgi:hypothetical protein
MLGLPARFLPAGRFTMRAVAAALSAAVFGALLAVSTAQASETRTFVIATASDGYGIDRCLTSGSACGQSVAAAFCRTQDFDQAVSFSTVQPGASMRLVALDGSTCTGAACESAVAIVCER